MAADGELWWHVYLSETDDASMTMTLGRSTLHPEALIARGGSVVELSDHTLHYAWSFDHEPCEAELEGLRPAEDGSRS